MKVFSLVAILALNLLGAESAFSNSSTDALKNIATLTGYKAQDGALTNDGKYLYGRDLYDNDFYVSDVTTGKTFLSVKLYNRNIENKVSPGGQIMTVPIDYSLTLLRQLPTGDAYPQLPGVLKVEFSPDGQYMVGLDKDEVPFFADLTTNLVTRDAKMPITRGGVTYLSKNANYFVDVSEAYVTKKIVAYDLKNKEVLFDTEQTLEDISLSPNETYVAFSYSADSLDIYNLKTKKMTSVYPHILARGLVFSPNEKYLAWIGEEEDEAEPYPGNYPDMISYLMVYDIAANKILSKTQIETNDLDLNNADADALKTKIKFLDDNFRIVTTSFKGFKIYNLQSGNILDEIKGDANYTGSLQLSPGGRYALVDSRDSLLLYDLEQKKQIQVGNNSHTQSNFTNPDLSAFFDGQGKYLGVRTMKSTLEVFELEPPTKK